MIQFLNTNLFSETLWRKSANALVICLYLHYYIYDTINLTPSNINPAKNFHMRFIGQVDKQRAESFSSMMAWNLKDHQVGSYP